MYLKCNYRYVCFPNKSDIIICSFQEINKVNGGIMGTVFWMCHFGLVAI